MPSLLQVSRGPRPAAGGADTASRFALGLMEKAVFRTRVRRLCYFVLAFLMAGALMYGFHLYQVAVGQFEVRLGQDQRFQVGWNAGVARRPDLRSGWAKKRMLQLQLVPGREYHIREVAVQRVRTYLEGLKTSFGGVVKDVSRPKGSKVQALLHNTSQTVDIAFDFHVLGQADGVVVAQFTCRKFLIEVQEKEGQAAESPGIWQAMSAVVQGKSFAAQIATNGTVLKLETSDIHGLVISRLHTMGALPLHMRSEFKVAPVRSKSPVTTLDAALAAQLKAVEGDFDSLGAQFNAQKDVHLGKSLELVLDTHGNLKACGAIVGDQAVKAKGNIVVVKRGGCQFLDKARNVQMAGAAGMVVVDFEKSDSLVYMGGTDVSISLPSVIVPFAKGEALIAMMQGHEDLDFKGAIGLGRPVYDSSSAEGRDHDHYDRPELAEIKQKTPPDFLGFNYLIEDQIKKRFSIFPPTPVGPGNFWTRTVVQTSPVPRSDLESYTMLKHAPCPKEAAVATAAGTRAGAGGAGPGASGVVRGTGRAKVPTSKAGKVGSAGVGNNCIVLHVDTTETPVEGAAGKVDKPAVGGPSAPGASKDTIKLISAASEHGLTGHEFGEIIVDARYEGRRGRLADSIIGCTSCYSSLLVESECVDTLLTTLLSPHSPLSPSHRVCTHSLAGQSACA